MNVIRFILGCFILTTFFSCKEIYKPVVISSTSSYLVVEGVLNAGQGPTNIRLTRTFKLDDTARLTSENNAQVIVEGKDNSTRILSMTANGNYTSPGLNLTINDEYRLRIKTANGKEYLSDYVKARDTPPIDSIGWEENQEGVQIHVSTHDPSNSTRYYRWDYDETWEIRSYYASGFKYVNGVVIDRLPSDNVTNCWKYGISNAILIGSSARLESDNIFRAPVAFFNRGDEKLAERYSILLKQYALDKQGYEFFEMMKKNSESLGSIFDAQPSEQKGNIRSVADPAELVVGYISSSVIREKRIFIANSQLARWYYYQDCPEILVRNHPDSIREAYDGGGSIYGAIYAPSGPIIYYQFSRIQCVECPSRYGSTIRPSYW